MESTDDDDETEENSSMLPPMKVGDKLDNIEVNAVQRFTHHPARYTEASLVKKLEELGIGRPSTYAPTISTVQKRGYVEKTDKEGKPRNYVSLTLAKNNTSTSSVSKEIKTENTGAEKSKLFPTDIGMVVNDFLFQYFPDILDFHFTAKVEAEFDEIAEGNLEWTKMLKDFYKPFHKTVEKTIDNSERASGERSLGVEPGTNKPIIVRIGRFGPLAQIGETIEGGEKPRFASLRGNQRMETITLQEALDLFKMPRIVGEYEGKEMKVGIGRFGPYVVHNNAFTSLGKEEDPYTIGGQRCIELIDAKRAKDLAKIIRVYDENPELKVLNGRWGPCIALGKEFFRIPKTTDPATLEFADVVALLGGVAGYEQKMANALLKNQKGKKGAKKFGAKKAEPKTKGKAKVVKLVKEEAPAKKTVVKKAVAKKSAPVKKVFSKTTAPKRTIKATKKKAAKKK